MNTYFYTTSTPDSGSSQLPGPGSRRSRQQCSLLHRTEIDGYSPTLHHSVTPIPRTRESLQIVLSGRNDGLSFLPLSLLTVLPYKDVDIPTVLSPLRSTLRLVRITSNPTVGRGSVIHCTRQFDSSSSSFGELLKLTFCFY